MLHLRLEEAPLLLCLLDCRDIIADAEDLLDVPVFVPDGLVGPSDPNPLAVAAYVFILIR